MLPISISESLWNSLWDVQEVPVWVRKCTEGAGLPSSAHHGGVWARLGLGDSHNLSLPAADVTEIIAADRNGRPAGTSARPEIWLWAV